MHHLGMGTTLGICRICHHEKLSQNRGFLRQWNHTQMKNAFQTNTFQTSGSMKNGLFIGLNRIPQNNNLYQMILCWDLRRIVFHEILSNLSWNTTTSNQLSLLKTRDWQSLCWMFLACHLISRGIEWSIGNYISQNIRPASKSRHAKQESWSLRLATHWTVSKSQILIIWISKSWKLHWIFY